MKFRKNLRPELNRWISAIIVLIGVLSVFYWLRSEVACTSIIFVLYLILTEFIFYKCEIKGDELCFVNFLNPFGKKIQIESICEIKEIADFLSKKHTGVRITTTKGKKYDLFIENRELFITQIKKQNENITVK